MCVLSVEHLLAPPYWKKNQFEHKPSKQIRQNRVAKMGICTIPHVAPSKMSCFLFCKCKIYPAIVMAGEPNTDPSKFGFGLEYDDILTPKRENWYVCLLVA